jgi:hypothetical protein
MDETTAIVLDQVPTAALDLQGHPMDPQDHLIMDPQDHLIMDPRDHLIMALPVPVSMALLAVPLTALTTLMDPALSCSVMKHQRTTTLLTSISSFDTEAVVLEEMTASL